MYRWSCNALTKTNATKSPYMLKTKRLLCLIASETAFWRRKRWGLHTAIFETFWNNWQSCPLYAVTGQVCRGVKVGRVWTFLSSSLFYTISVFEERPSIHLVHTFSTFVLFIEFRLSLWQRAFCVSFRCDHSEQVILCCKMWSNDTFILYHVQCLIGLYISTTPRVSDPAWTSSLRKTTTSKNVGYELHRYC